MRSDTLALRRESGVDAESFQVGPGVGTTNDLERMFAAGKALLRIQGDAQQHRKIIDKERCRTLVFAI